MATFKDSTDREWCVDVNVGAIKRVISRSGVNLALITAPRKPDSGQPLMTEVWNDPILLGDILYSLCKPQADTEKLDVDAFDALLTGPTLAAAFDAFWEAVDSFFMARRPDVAALIREHNRLVVNSVAASLKKVNATLGQPATDTQASAESTPNHTPSTNSP